MANFIRSLEARLREAANAPASGSEFTSEWSKHCRSMSDRTTAHHDVVASQMALRDALAQIRKQAVAGAALDITTLDQADATFKAMQDSLAVVLPTEAYNHYCPEHARTMAQKVFDIPELLEEILVKLDMQELLRVMTINRQWFHAIESSVTLRRKLGLDHESLTGCFAMPLTQASVPGFTADFAFSKPASFTPTGYRQMALQENEVYVSARFFETGPRLYGSSFEIPRSLGARWRKMLVCQQPAVTSMTVDLECCGSSAMSRYLPWLHGHASVTPNPTITNSKGLTLGDLFDAHKKFTTEHQTCPYADEYVLNPTSGKVQPNPCFNAIVSVCTEDCETASKRQKDIALRERMEIALKDRQQLQQYTHAKQAAHNNGQPVPSFQEWKASQTDDDSPEA